MIAFFKDLKRLSSDWSLQFRVGTGCCCSQFFQGILLRYPSCLIDWGCFKRVIVCFSFYQERAIAIDSGNRLILNNKWAAIEIQACFFSRFLNDNLVFIMSEVFDQLELLRKLLRFEIMISRMLQLNFTFGVCRQMMLLRCLIIQQLLLRNFSFLGNFDAVTIFNWLWHRLTLWYTFVNYVFGFLKVSLSRIQNNI